MKERTDSWSGEPVLENEALVVGGVLVLYVLLSGAVLVASLGFVHFWISTRGWERSAMSWTLLTGILAIAGSQCLLRWSLLTFMRRPSHIRPTRQVRVAVVTTIVPSKESIEMLELALEALKEIESPHDTWVLDEEDDAEVKSLCARLGVKHFTRKGSERFQANSGLFERDSKHGNYNSWLDAVGYERYDVLTQFDPDHIPVKEYLQRVLGYLEVPTVAFVQCTPAYYNQGASLIARGAAEEVYGYHSTSQMVSFGLGSVPGNGSHMTHRLAALRAIGGFPPHNGEDLLSSMRYEAHGWRGIYLPEILARGIAPVDWSGYLNQQIRWARSDLDIRLRHYPRLRTGLRPGARFVGFILSLYNAIVGANGVLWLLLALTALATGTIPEPVRDLVGFWGLCLGATLLTCEFFRQRHYIGGASERGFHWRAMILLFAKWPYLLSSVYRSLIGKGHSSRRVSTLSIKSGDAQAPASRLKRHLVIAALLSSAYTWGLIRHDPPIALHVAAVASILFEILLFASERLPGAKRFDLALARRFHSGSA